MPEGSSKKQMLAAVLGGGIEDDPMKVLERLDSGAFSYNRSTWTYGHVFRAIAQEDPALAQQMAAAMPTGEAKKSALVGSLQKRMVDDFEGALGWLDSLPKDGSVYRARKEVLQSLRSKDFETVRAIVEAETDPANRQEYFEHIQFQR